MIRSIIMFATLLCLLLVSFTTQAVVVTKGTFIYSWLPPATRVGGTPIAHEEIGKYQVFWKLQSAAEYNVVDLTRDQLLFQKSVLFGYYEIKVRVCDVDDKCSDFAKLRQFQISAHPNKVGYSWLTAGVAE